MSRQFPRPDRRVFRQGSAPAPGRHSAAFLARVSAPNVNGCGAGDCAFLDARPCGSSPAKDAGCTQQGRMGMRNINSARRYPQTAQCHQRQAFAREVVHHAKDVKRQRQPKASETKPSARFRPPQVSIARTDRLIPCYPHGNSYQMTRPALMQPVTATGMSDCIPLRAGCHHFAAEISFNVPPCPTTRKRHRHICYQGWAVAHPVPRIAPLPRSSPAPSATG